RPLAVCRIETVEVGRVGLVQESKVRLVQEPQVRLVQESKVRLVQESKVRLVQKRRYAWIADDKVVSAGQVTRQCVVSVVDLRVDIGYNNSPSCRKREGISGVD